MTQSSSEPFSQGKITTAIVAGCCIAVLSFGFAATFGMFLRPITEDLGWPREVFSLSVGLQLLFWGLTQPFAGMVADRAGSARVLAVGAVAAAAGFWLRGAWVDADVFVLAGILVGIGTGACSFPIVTVALGKVVAPERRSFILGLGTAAGSFGMLAAALLTPRIIDAFGWVSALYIISASYLLVLPASVLIGRVSRPTAQGAGAAGFGYAVKTAFADRSYVLLFFGFYVCGFHVAFIQTHLPAYIQDMGLHALMGGVSLALIGAFNIAGSFASGWSGSVLPKKSVLSAIYFGRAVVIAGFILIPLSTTSLYVFSGLMGLLWLSTVPLTMGLVAQTQGMTYLSTLTGIIFLGHQLGSFTGAWLGGRIFDLYLDYTPMWWAAVAFGLLATLLHLPIREEPGPLARQDAASG